MCGHVLGDSEDTVAYILNGGSSECSLVHSTASLCVSGGVFTARPGTGFGTSSTFYKSTLSGTATPTMDGILVECFGPLFARDAANIVGNSTLQVLGHYSVVFVLFLLLLLLLFFKSFAWLCGIDCPREVSFSGPSTNINHK